MFIVYNMSKQKNLQAGLTPIFSIPLLLTFITLRLRHIIVLSKSCLTLKFKAQKQAAQIVTKTLPAFIFTCLTT